MSKFYSHQYTRTTKLHNRIFIIVFFFSLILAGCGKQESHVQPSVAEVSPYSEAGWTLYKKTTEGYAIALPSTWKQISADPNKMEASIKAVTQDPAAVNSLMAFTKNRIASGVNMLALDAGGKGLLQLSWRTSDKNDVSLDSIANIWMRSMEQSGQQLIGPRSHRHVTLPIGEAQELKYMTSETATTQYMASHQKDFYILTLGANPEKMSAYDSVFTKIGQSFQSLR
jgi:hypothetical protein